MLINIPAFELQVVAGNVVERRHRVIVGKPVTTTPTLTSTIRYFTLAPGWHVPHSIATKEILPHLRRDTGYLARNNYELYDRMGRPQDATHVSWSKVTAQNFPYTIRQSAGCRGAGAHRCLGRVRGLLARRAAPGGQSAPAAPGAEQLCPAHPPETTRPAPDSLP